jgi:hypothetical protein
MAKSMEIETISLFKVILQIIYGWGRLQLAFGDEQPGPLIFKQVVF